MSLPPPVLVMTVGLPRSGKSTWAVQTGLPAVNPDSVRLAMHGQAFFAPAEPLVWAHVRLMVRSLFIAGHRIVILDATNVSERRRQEWLSKEWECQYQCFQTPVEECIRRAHSSGKPELVPVIYRMSKELTWPRERWDIRETV